MKSRLTPEMIAEEMASPGISDEAAYADETLVRRAIEAELDAVNLYDQIARATKNEAVKNVMLHLSREEKVHVGELEKILDDIDSENAAAREEGRKEAEEH